MWRRLRPVPVVPRSVTLMGSAAITLQPLLVRNLRDLVALPRGCGPMVARGAGAFGEFTCFPNLLFFSSKICRTISVVQISFRRTFRCRTLLTSDLVHSASSFCNPAAPLRLPIAASAAAPRRESAFLHRQKPC